MGFNSWINCFRFSVGFNRYGYGCGHGFIVVAECSVYNDRVSSLVDDLDGGDMDSYNAFEKLETLKEDGQINMAFGVTPDIGMSILIDELRVEHLKMNPEPKGK